MSQLHSLLALEILEYLQTYFEEPSSSLETLCEATCELLQDSSPELALRLSELGSNPTLHEDEDFLNEILQEIQKELPIE